MKKTIALVSSARKTGNTWKTANALEQQWPMQVVDLDKVHIEPYCYQQDKAVDGFYPLVQRMLAYPRWVFITPIYWSSMTETMKRFFDRITDLLDAPQLRAQARALAHKEVFVVCTSTKPTPSPAFVGAFEEICDYLAMCFKGVLHLQGTVCDSPVALNQRIRHFAQRHYQQVMLMK